MTNKNTNETTLKNEFSFLLDFGWKDFLSFLKTNKALVLTLLITTFFMYGLKLTHYLYGIDTELYMESGRFLNWISIGRFGLVALQKLWMRGTFFNPYSSIFLALIFLYLGTLFFCYLLHKFSREKLNAVLLFIFALTFISGGVWNEQLYFTMQAAECIFIMALVPFNVYLLYYGFALNIKKGIIANIILTCFITSVYQGVLPLYMGTVFACYMLEHDSSPEFPKDKNNVGMCIKMLVAIFVSVILYFIINKIILLIANINESDYLTKQLGGNKETMNHSPLAYFCLYLYRLTVGNISFINELFIPLFSKYAKSGTDILLKLNNGSTAYANLLYIPVTITFLIYSFTNSRKNILYTLCGIGIVFCILAFPIIGGGSATMRTQYIIPFATAFMFIYVLKNFSGLWFKICSVIFLINCFYSAQLIGNLNYSDKLRFDDDVKLANDLDIRIRKYMIDNEIEKDTPIYFFGFKETQRNKNFLLGDMTGYSSFYWGAETNENTAGAPNSTSRRTSFINTLLCNYFIGNDIDFMMNECQPIINEMPSYPADDCIQYFDNAILIKLSEHPYSYPQ